MPRVARTIGPAQAAIFAAQLLMLDDPLLTRRADELVRAERINADWALERAAAELQRAVRARRRCLASRAGGRPADVSGRLHRNLRPDRDPLVDLIHELEPPLMLVADELPPSVAAQLDWSRVRGLVCDVGGPTHHTVILVRSLGIPAVVGLAGATQRHRARPDAWPSTARRRGRRRSVRGDARALARQSARCSAPASGALSGLRDRPAETADGVRVTLEANLEIADEVHRVREAAPRASASFDPSSCSMRAVAATPRQRGCAGARRIAASSPRCTRCR